MRVLVISRNSPVQPPPEMLPMLLQGFKDWRTKWRSKMENFEFFSSGGGGWGVLNSSDDKEISQIMMEYPFGPFSTNELIPTVEGDEALERFTQTVNEMLAGMQK